MLLQSLDFFAVYNYVVRCIARITAHNFVIVRVRQIVCPVIPGTPKSVVGPLDILPGCSVGTLDLALAASVNITAIIALSQTRDHVIFEQVQWSFKASRVVSDDALKP